MQIQRCALLARLLVAELEAWRNGDGRGKVRTVGLLVVEGFILRRPFAEPDLRAQWYRKVALIDIYSLSTTNGLNNGYCDPREADVVRRLQPKDLLFTRKA
jgi:hypothetical protein